MLFEHRLTKVYDSAERIPFDDTSKFIFFSDCHRGDDSWADDFSHNQHVFIHALQHYYEKGFTYIEVGDGDDLWENRSFDEIKLAHRYSLLAMREFHKDKRLFIILGNHDFVKRNSEILHYLYDERTNEKQPLFDGIRTHEGLILKHSKTGNEIFIVHGHQGSLRDDIFWRFSRFFVRYFWSYIQLLGLQDPSSTSDRPRLQGKAREKMMRWIQKKKVITICGHTHRSWFSEDTKMPYFNTGSCVHPRCITGIEIERGKITFIKWWYRTNKDGVLYVDREQKTNPKKIKAYYAA